VSQAARLERDIFFSYLDEVLRFRVEGAVLDWPDHDFLYRPATNYIL
jgi:hypothetical protein